MKQEEDSKNILIVEDEKIYHTLIKRSFTKHSKPFSLTITETVAEAKKQAQNGSFDLIIADYYLPDGNGTAMLEDGSITKRMPVIILTGRGTEEIAAAVMKEGASDYVVKSEYSVEKLPELSIKTIKAWRTEQELKETQAKLNKLFETMADGIVVVNTEGQITSANPAGRKILSLKKDKIVGRYFQEKTWKQIDEEGNPFPVEKLPLSICLTEKREALEVEHGIISEDGEVKWLSVNAAPLFGEDGSLNGAVAGFRDITQRKKMEKDLEKALNFSLTIFDQLPTPKLRTDAAADCNYVNRAWTELTGKSMDESLGDGWKLALHPKDRKEFTRAFNDAFSEQRELKREARFLGPEDTIIWCIVVARPYKNLEDRFAGYILSFSDITERKREEEFRIKELERELSTLEKLTNNRQTTITAKSLGIKPLNENFPILFKQYVDRFSSLLEQLFDSRVHKTDLDVTPDLRNLSRQLGRMQAGARDIIELYTKSLKNTSENSPTGKSQVLAEEGRIMALELMGYLANFYRNFYILQEEVPKEGLSEKNDGTNKA